jgi:RNA polymerase sigma factor (sigma-70 family)
MELLAHTVELRRIKQLEADLFAATTITTSTSTSTSTSTHHTNKRKAAGTMPMLSVRCQAAGFGDDLDAYERAFDLGHSARETLVTRNIGLVHFCINEVIGKRQPRGNGNNSGNGNQRSGGLQSLSREDLVQEGAIGLARAVDRWNPEIGGKFSTYAVYWIRAAIFRCIAERDDLMRVPEHVSTAIRKVSKAAKRLGLEFAGDSIISAVYNNDASWKEAQAAKELAEEAGLTPKQLAATMKVRARRITGIMSYEVWMQQGKDFEVDLTPVSENDSTMATMETEHLKKTLSRFLRPKEMEALSWRYGLTSEDSPKPAQARDYVSEAETVLFGSTTPAKQELTVKGKWGEAMSFVEVGKRMEVSSEYGRRLCHAALNKLRQAAEEGAIEPALLF